MVPFHPLPLDRDGHGDLICPRCDQSIRPAIRDGDHMIHVECRPASGGSMWFTSLRRIFDGLVERYNRSVDESHGRFAQGDQLRNDARAGHDAARTVRSDRRSWCSRCGQRLHVTEAGRDGIHARCHGH